MSKTKVVSNRFFLFFFISNDPAKDYLVDNGWMDIEIVLDSKVCLD